MLSLPRATLQFEAPVENIAKKNCVQELEIARQTQMENALNIVLESKVLTRIN